MIVAYAGWGLITFCISQRAGHHFFSFDKGGVMCFSEEFCWYLPVPLPLEIMNGPLSWKLSMQLAYSELL